MTDIDKLRKNYEDFERKVRQVRQDEMLSDKAKRLELQQAYSEARAAYEEFVEEYRTGVRERLRETRKAVFSAPKLGKDDAFNMLRACYELDQEWLGNAESGGTAGERANRRICIPMRFSPKFITRSSYRDALDRTQRMNDPRELSDLLARAEITGDRALARACLYRGYQLPGEAAKTAIVQSYYAKYPDELPAWDEFMNAATETNKLESVGISMTVGVPEPEKPRELGFGSEASGADPYAA